MLISNKFLIIIILIFWCSMGNSIRLRKASIVTTVGETPNNQQWSVPFYDNNFGLLTTSVPIPPPPQPVPGISTAPPAPTTTIGRTNSISTSQTVSPGGNNPVNLAPPNSLSLPTVFTNPALLDVPIVSSNNTRKIIYNIDPNNMINYYSTVPTFPKTVTYNNVPSTTQISTITSTPRSTSNPTSSTTSSTSIASSSSNAFTTSFPDSTDATTSRNPMTSPPSSISVTEITKSSSSSPPPSSYRPLGPDCGYKPKDLSNQVTITNSGGTLNNFQVEVPAVLKFDVNITSVPNYIVSVSPLIEGDSDVVEISSSRSVGKSFSNTINIDLSDPHLDLGWSSSVLPTFATSPPSQNKLSENKCIGYYSTGRRTIRNSKVQVFIINGQNSKQKEFPHMAALGYGAKTDNQWLCGGSLISEHYVITAGHCLSPKPLGPVQFVRLGTTTLQTETLDSSDYNVIQRIPYPTYVEGRQYDDIALLQLDRQVEFSEYIAPICLYTSTVLDGITLTATGWGRTTPTGSTAKELKKVDLEVMSYDVCQKAYSAVPKEELPYGILRDSQICAGTADGSKDTCQGDSGGPLSMVQDGRMYLVGITSFGIGCAQPGVPGVYTRVSHYLPWIEQTIWEK